MATRQKLSGRPRPARAAGALHRLPARPARCWRPPDHPAALEPQRGAADSDRQPGRARSPVGHRARAVPAAAPVGAEVRAVRGAGDPRARRVGRRLLRRRRGTLSSESRPNRVRYHGTPTPGMLTGSPSTPVAWIVNRSRSVRPCAQASPKSLPRSGSWSVVSRTGCAASCGPPCGWAATCSRISASACGVKGRRHTNS